MVAEWWQALEERNMQVRFAPDAPECPDSRLISFHSTGHSEEAGQGRGRREPGQERRVGKVKKGRRWTKEEGGESGARSGGWVKARPSSVQDWGGMGRDASGPPSHWRLRFPSSAEAHPQLKIPYLA